MKLFKLSIILTTVVLFASCSSKKNTANAAKETSEMSMEAKKMTENGFKMGTIIASKKEGDCPYMIEVQGETESYFLDPMNIDESFKKNGEKIWFTYSPLRRMNRCVKANPVNIIEMKKREG